MADPTMTVTLTEIEARALRLAVIFGKPDKDHEPLESALRKLRAASATMRRATPGEGR